MPTIKIHSIPITLPFNPYPAQLITMSKIITTISSKSSALIESPTGTGKTLSILCSILAYKQSTRDPCKVFICTRTHKQIDQMISQLRKTIYKPNIAILASRNQLCINPLLKQENDKNKACSDLLKKNSCSFFAHKDRVNKDNTILDLEELKSAGRKCNGCPFFASRIMEEKAELVFAPYNYIIDPAIRNAMSIELKNSVVVIDEAHNVEDFCRSAGSVFLARSSIDFMMSEVSNCIKKGFKTDEVKKELICIYDLVRRFGHFGEGYGRSDKKFYEPYDNANTENQDDGWKSINKDRVDNENGHDKDLNKNTGFIKDSRNSYVDRLGFKDLNKDIVIKNQKNSINDTFTTNNILIANNDNLKRDDSVYLNNKNIENKKILKDTIFDNHKFMHNGYRKNETSGSFVKKGKEIVEFFSLIKINEEKVLQCKGSLANFTKNDEYKDLLSMNTLNTFESLINTLENLFFVNSDAYAFAFKKEGNEFNYNFWLLDPSVIFTSIVRSVKSIILLSGTLTPFKSFSSELGHTFGTCVEAPHIVNKSNVFVGCIQRGNSGKEILGTYKNTESFEYLDQIKDTIIKIRDKVKNKGGTLVFVPSYSFLDNLIKRIGKDRRFLQEPKNGLQFDAVFLKYKRSIERKEGPILLCVYRGRASEGMDFKDEYARAVIAIGIPFPSYRDLEVICKREYNDAYKQMNGSAWYDIQAYRAVNQALGRVLRHKEDWGGVFMLDSRYTEKKSFDLLPKWVRDNFKGYGKCDECYRDFEEFVKNK
ncbi:hypothetical protein COBT_001967 [Conglomerata obtusa]